MGIAPVTRQHSEKRKWWLIWKDLERIPPDVFILERAEILQVNLIVEKSPCISLEPPHLKLGGLGKAG